MTRYSHKIFQPHMNSTFYVPFDNGYIAELILRKIDIYQELTKNEQSEYLFSLYFEDFGIHDLEQSTYIMKHKFLGEIDLFITPIGRSSRNGTIYQAIFN